VTAISEGFMRIVALLVLIVALAGCATERGRSAEAMIAPAVRFVTPGPQALGYRVVAEQMISAHYRGDSFVWEAHIDVSPEKQEIVGLDAFGRRAFTMIRQGDALSYEAASWLPAAIKPGNVLADIAILYWPQAAVEAALAGSGASVAATAAGRSIAVGGAEIVRVDYDDAGAREWNGTAHLRNLAFGYQLDIQSVRLP
jgi:hypothetical protein